MNCAFCFHFTHSFQEERFAFSRDTRDDAVFASLAEKIPQVRNALFLGCVLSMKLIESLCLASAYCCILWV